MTARRLSIKSCQRWLLPPLALLLLGLLLLLWIAWQRADLAQPIGSYRLLDRHGQWLADVDGPRDGEYGYWPLEQVPARVAAATLALEDARFYQHPGVDAVSVLRAIKQNLQCGCVRSGASTIAMQTVRLQDPRPRTFWNKSMEAVTAIMLTLRHGREAVLRQYLRLVPYGNGSHGIAHAASMYLDKPVDDLSWAEIALLSAIPRAPDRNNPLTVSGHHQAVQRAQRILLHLHAEQVLDSAELDLAQRQLPQLRLQPMRQRSRDNLHAVLALAQQLRRQGVESGVVRSQLDRAWQQTAQQSVAAWLDAHRERGAQQAALMVVDREHLAVRVLIGSGDYFGEQAGALDYSEVARSSGSILKPLLYGLALERGAIEPDSILLDTPLEAPGVRNADRRHFGPMLPRYALANSRNVPAVALVQSMGLARSYAFLQSLRLHRGERAVSDYGPGLAIGAMPVRLRDVMAAYGALANDGYWQPLRWHAQGPDSNATAVLGRDASRLISHFLSDPQARLPSFARMGALEYDYPVAVKTGTSQSLRDVWAVAYSRQFIVGVWAGRPDNQPMHQIRGASVAALVQTVLGHVEQRQETWRLAEAFPPPQNYQQADICLDSGLPAQAECPRRVEEWLPLQRRKAAGMPLALASSGDGLATQDLQLATPADGAVYYRNPEAPEDLQTLRFALRRPPAGEVVWHVDGEPYAVQDADQALHLPMQPGSVQVYAQRAFRPERSAEVRVTVR
jgi:penicillin-binding protein 1C